MSRAAWASLLALALVSGCQESPAGPGSLPATQPVPDTPYAVVLGTAQDAGLPQIGCELDNCERARSEPGFGRLVTSLLLADPVSGDELLHALAERIEKRLEEMARFPDMNPGPESRFLWLASEINERQRWKPVRLLRGIENPHH